MKRYPPKKKKGQGTGPRTINGIIKDLPSLSTLLGTSEKKVRSMVARQMLPYRKWGGRLIFLEQEIKEFLE